MKKLFRITGVLLLAAVFITGCHHPFDRLPEEHPEAWTPTEVENMLGGNDPYEGFNRAMFSCTDFLMTYGADPLGRVYTTIFPRPFVHHFNNVCVNLEYPARAVSLLLQARWGAAGTESLRFLANTTLGIAGIFDVAKSWWGIYPAEADFGQAFYAWGIGPGETFILPVVPSMNGRDLTGLFFDTAFDLKTYIPYAGYATFLNRMTVAQSGYAGIVDGAFDPYKNYRQLMLIRRELQLRHWFYEETLRQIEAYKKSLGPDGKVVKQPVPPCVPPARPSELSAGTYSVLPNYFSQGTYTDTLRVMLFQVQRDRDWWYMPLSLFNSDFWSDSYCRKVEIAADRPKLRYSFWKAPEETQVKARKEKLAVMLSGIGGTYNNSTLLALAEQFNNAGFKVLTLDSTFNWRFIVADGKCRLPGYLPDDAARVRRALKAVLADLKEREWIDDPEIVICGYSMGGIQTLKLAELEEKDPTMKITRFIAVNPPVSLETALNSIDSMVNSTAGWSKSKMREKVITAAGNLLIKFAPHYLHAGDKEDIGKYRSFMLPLDPESAKAVAGIFLKLSMCEMLMAAHKENPIPGFKEYKWGDRNELYQQLDKVTFKEYAHNILAPSYPGRSVEELLADSHLKSIAGTLSKSPKIRVFHNADDFLLSPAERAWLDSLLKERITWFSNGGHLGNLYYKQVLEAVIKAAEW
ncbi:MAG: VacJ family lipoprotein [Lentisphaeria bacterium]|nr:VacJ family lipoprotein [Lentisphaeria bacterium]